jgi:hypothetical protein
MKKRYPDKEKAEIAIIKKERQYKSKTEDKMMAYLCRECGLWHIGKKYKEKR